MLIFIVACTVPLALMVVGDIVDKFHRGILGAIIGLTGFGLFCVVVVGIAVFILI